MMPTMRAMNKGGEKSTRNWAQLNLSRRESKHIDEAERRIMSRVTKRCIEIFPFQHFKGAIKSKATLSSVVPLPIKPNVILNQSIKCTMEQNLSIDSPTLMCDLEK
jgi:hypothetical protein